MCEFVGENEVAFDPQELGFPSIHGCQAIVYQTNAGLFGYHSYGGSGDDAFQPRATKFAEFVNSHGVAANQATRLYGVAFVGDNRRGYSGQAKAKWKIELLAYAGALHYTGKISGYDLQKSLPVSSTSAYVEFRKNGQKCDVFIREWTAAEQTTKIASKPNPNPADHRMLKIRNQGKVLTLEDIATVGTGVARNNLLQISKIQLR